MILRAVHSGFWLGVLTGKTFRCISEKFYSAKTQFINNERNLKGLSEQEQKQINKYFEKSDKILVAGAAGGREVLALSKKGFDVSGLTAIHSWSVMEINFSRSTIIPRG